MSRRDWNSAAFMKVTSFTTTRSTNTVKRYSHPSRMAVRLNRRSPDSPVRPARHAGPEKPLLHWRCSLSDGPTRPHGLNWDFYIRTYAISPQPKTHSRKPWRSARYPIEHTTILVTLFSLKTRPKTRSANFVKPSN